MGESKHMPPLDEVHGRLVQRADDHRHEHEHLATMTTGRGLRRRIAHHQRAESDFRTAAAIVHAHPLMLEALRASPEIHTPDCADPGGFRPDRCTCWVAKRRAALSAAGYPIAVPAQTDLPPPHADDCGLDCETPCVRCAAIKAATGGEP